MYSHADADSQLALSKHSSEMIRTLFISLDVDSSYCVRKKKTSQSFEVCVYICMFTYLCGD